MAQRTLIQLLDDIDGTEAAETVSFGLDGTAYEIDLNEKNAAALRKALSKFVPNARKVSKNRPQAAGRKSSQASKNPPKLVREWAKSNGYTVPDRGRIPEDVQAAYDAAHAA